MTILSVIHNFDCSMVYDTVIILIGLSASLAVVPDRSRSTTLRFRLMRQNKIFHNIIDSK